MTATQKDIAKMLGISHVAVSYALNGSLKVAEETRRKVFEKARSLGYRPNGAAKAVRRGKFNTLALLMAEHSLYSNLPSQLLYGIEKKAVEKNQHLSFAVISDNMLTNPSFLPKLLREKASDGLLINYHYNFPKKLTELIERYKIYSVWINSKHPYNAVYPDEKNAGKMAVQYLVERGFKKIAYIDFSHGKNDLENCHYSAADRLAGYKEAIFEAGLEPDIFMPEKGCYDNLTRLLESISILKSKKCPEAFIAHGDTSAIPLCTAGFRLGIPVGSDSLPVVVFGDHQIEFFGMNLPTLIVPNFEVGTLGVEILLERINKNKKHISSISVPLELKVNKEEKQNEN